MAVNLQFWVKVKREIKKTISKRGPWSRDEWHWNRGDFRQPQGKWRERRRAIRQCARTMNAPGVSTRQQSFWSLARPRKNTVMSVPTPEGKMEVNKKSTDLRLKLLCGWDEESNSTHVGGLDADGTRTEKDAGAQTHFPAHAAVCPSSWA